MYVADFSNTKLYSSPEFSIYSQISQLFGFFNSKTPICESDSAHITQASCKRVPYYKNYNI